MKTSAGQGGKRRLVGASQLTTTQPYAHLFAELVLIFAWIAINVHVLQTPS